MKRAFICILSRPEPFSAASPTIAPPTAPIAAPMRAPLPLPKSLLWPIAAPVPAPIPAPTNAPRSRLVQEMVKRARRGKTMIFNRCVVMAEFFPFYCAARWKQEVAREKRGVLLPFFPRSPGDSGGNQRLRSRRNFALSRFWLFIKTLVVFEW